MSEQVEPVSAALRISHYSTLGVAEHSTQDQIRDAYRRAVQRCHPDRFQGMPEAEAAFKEITVAYKVLRDPRSRREYDRRLGLNQGRRGGIDEPADLHETSEAAVGASEMQRFARLAEGHARRGLDAPKIASHLIAEGSPYQLAWHLAWQAHRRVLAHALADQPVSGPGSQGPISSPAPAAAESERGGKWQGARERHRRPFQVLMARMSKSPR